MHSFRKGLLFSVLVYEVASADKSIDLNFGLAPTKSILGVSYTLGQNQLNIGLKSFWIHSSSGYQFEPGITFNRYLGKSGFYGSLTYAPMYQDYNTVRWRFSDTGGYVPEDLHLKGWKVGTFFLGAGKSFQFTRWGLHADGGFVTPADADFARAWGYWLGVGLSYRFRLE